MNLFMKNICCVLDYILRLFFQKWNYQVKTPYFLLHILFCYNHKSTITYLENWGNRKKSKNIKKHHNFIIQKQHFIFWCIPF